MSNVRAQKMLRFRRLDPYSERDVLEFQKVLRGAQSFVYATHGIPPTDEDAVRMIRTLPDGLNQTDIHALAIYEARELCGFAFVARGYPKKNVAYLALLVIMEVFQSRSLGAQALRHLEAPGGHFKLLHLWPGKLLQAGRFRL